MAISGDGDMGSLVIFVVVFFGYSHVDGSLTTEAELGTGHALGGALVIGADLEDGVFTTWQRMLCVKSCRRFSS